MPRKTRTPASIRQAVASFGGTTTATINPFVVRAARSKHGPRSGSRLQDAQMAILALHPLALPPRSVNHLDLARRVNKQLGLDPDHELSPNTVRRALQTLRDTNL